VPDRDYAHIPTASRDTLNRLEMGVEEGLVKAFSDLRNVDYEILLDHGSIRSKLLAVANRCKIDVIVIGTHGWRGVKKLLKGSTAEEIACLATMPVLIVGPHATGRSEFKRILYETDFSKASGVAMPHAFSLAEVYDASLLCLHVNDWSSREPPTAAGPKTINFFNEQINGYHGGNLVARCEVRVEFGSRTERIVNVAAAHQTDLIVMGLHASTGIKARIAAHLPGSTAYDVITEVSCPVLTVPVS
jgi:nucleotide-binding universal stress UspA family protein